MKSMKIKQVKVIKSKLQSYWYNDKIGQEFYVTSISMFDGEFKYKVIEVGDHNNNEPSPRYFDSDDIKVIKEFDGDIIRKITISIHVNGEINESGD